MSHLREVFLLDFTLLRCIRFLLFMLTSKSRRFQLRYHILTLAMFEDSLLLYAYILLESSLLPDKPAVFATGYGDIHAVNLREMIFVMIFVSFDMILGAYLIGNMTAITVKGSKTEKFRDKMTDLIKYMNRNRLGKDIRNQIKGHLRLQHESSYTEASALQDLPISIRAKVKNMLRDSFFYPLNLFFLLYWISWIQTLSFRKKEEYRN